MLVFVQWNYGQKVDGCFFHMPQGPFGQGEPREVPQDSKRFLGQGYLKWVTILLGREM